MWIIHQRAVAGHGDFDTKFGDSRMSFSRQADYMAGSPRGFETNVVQAAPGFGGQARFPRERRQSSAAAVVDALVIGPRRAEKIGRLLRERMMRRRVGAS